MDLDHALAADGGLLLADDDAAQVLGCMGGAGREDGDVEPLALAIHRHAEVPRHVVDGDAVLVEQRAGDALAHLLLGCVLDRLVADVVQQHAVFQGRGLVLARRVWG